MKRSTLASTQVTFLIILALIGSGPTFGQMQEQIFELRPGWNAIYLEVQPEPSDATSVFQSIPGLASAWSWNPDIGSVEYIQNPAELMPDQPGWLMYIPSSRPEAFLSTLFAVRAHRSYLVFLEGTEPVTWSVAGYPRMRKKAWKPDSYNLIGFAVNPVSPPTFASYFTPSSAHTGQTIYRLSNSGAWEQVEDPAVAEMRPGEAFWIYTAGASDYSGPLKLELEQGNGLDFGSTLVEQTLSIKNLTAMPMDVDVRAASTSIPVPLRYWDRGTSPVEANWKTLPATQTLSVAAGEEYRLRLAVKRPLNSGGIEYRSVLEITSDTGAWHLVPVSAQGRDQRGLWAGYAVINAVSESASADHSTPTPTASEFQFRLLLHWDNAGQTRLLKQVIQMWQEGTYKPDPDDPSKRIVDQPGHFVLLADNALIGQFSGAALRDGRPVGRRLSAIAFDFAGATLDMTGNFGDTLSATIDLPAAFPTNPFQHRYHPDHNNLDEEGDPKEEAYAVTRQITLEFTQDDPSGLPSASWGDTETGGVYKETIRGLHDADIHVEGTFRLHRAALTPVLNQ